MSKKLIIIRNRNSSLINQIDFSEQGQVVVLIQDAVYSEELRKKAVLLLEQDVIARKIEADNIINIDALLDEIIKADKVISI